VYVYIGQIAVSLVVSAIAVRVFGTQIVFILSILFILRVVVGVPFVFIFLFVFVEGVFIPNPRVARAVVVQMYVGFGLAVGPGVLFIICGEGLVGLMDAVETLHGGAFVSFMARPVLQRVATSRLHLHVQIHGLEFMLVA